MLLHHLLKLLWLVSLVNSLINCNQVYVSYSGYSLLRCLPKTTEQLIELQTLANDVRKYDSASSIKFWNEPIGLNGRVDIMVGPNEKVNLERRLTLSGLVCAETIQDIGQVIERQTETINSNNSSDYYLNFHSYGEIVERIVDFAKVDSRVKIEKIGKSYEKRDLYLIKISNNSTANKPIIFIDAGHHAREWATHSTLMYIMESLINDNMPKISNYQQVAAKKNFSSHLESYDFWFIPVINPDGYEYSRTTDRMWRKTRSPTTVEDCAGVDPNRNYNFHWLDPSEESLPCDETYHGDKPFSESETRALARVLDENGSRIALYLSLHSYSQLILLPYNYAPIEPSNLEQLTRVAQAGVDGILTVRKTQYLFGVSAEILYPAYGTAEDYAYANANISISYGIELTDQAYGFLMPAEEIIPVGQETTAGVSGMIDALTTKLNRRQVI